MTATGNQPTSDDAGQSGASLYVCMISVHGLIRGECLELGRDADNGGQIRYVVELTKALAACREVSCVDLVTRRVVCDEVDDDYAQPVEELSPGARLVRIGAGPQGYLPKQQLWDHLDDFVDNLVEFLRKQERLPDIIHSHYADAGYVGARVAHILDIPLLHTGHSLGRVKMRRLLAAGMPHCEIEERYSIQRRIDAEEHTLASAMAVVTSTSQEISEQYELYDFYQPNRMRVLPPGTDLDCFHPPEGDEAGSAAEQELARFLRAPEKPMILVLARLDARKNLLAHIEAYASDPQLADMANLILVMGERDDPHDLEPDARELFQEILQLIDRHDLYGKVAYPKSPPVGGVAGYYRLAAASGGVHVNAALTEPFGLTLIEAAASGLPIVATSDGGPRDIIENCENGVLVDPLNADHIAAGIKEVLADKHRWKQRAQCGLSGVQQHYSWAAHARGYVDLARDVIERYDGVWFPASVLPERASFLDRALFTDIDQNLLGAPSEALAELSQMLADSRRKCAFGVVTARSYADARRTLRELKLPQPDILISSAGTRIHSGPKLELDQRWLQHIEKQWTPNVVERVLEKLPGLERQERSEQDHFKRSYYIDSDKAPTAEHINALLFREGQSVRVTLSFGRYLDVVPIEASKGLALRYVAGLWNIPLEHILVAGGCGMDEDMMRGKALSVVVSNRHSEELCHLPDRDRIYFSKQPRAAGILEAIRYYDFFSACRVPQTQRDASPA